MNLESLDPGKYIVAVSGGVDSVVLLDLLLTQDGLELIVAHVNHGIRADSDADEAFVKKLAEKNNLTFESTQLHLGSESSEEKARKKRYEFLEKILDQHRARAILTAHHQDDLLETAVINLMRGTKQKGLYSLKDREKLIRPLLEFTKKQILKYAKDNRLQWHEDSSNQDTKYLRNYVRLNVLSDLDESTRKQILDVLVSTKELGEDIDKLLLNLGDNHVQSTEDSALIDRNWFILLPTEVRLELMANLIRKLPRKTDISAKQLKYIDLFMRTAKVGASHPINNELDVAIQDAKVKVIAKTF